jgi:SAM-dependent methyltransferase
MQDSTGDTRHQPECDPAPLPIEYSDFSLCLDGRTFSFAKPACPDALLDLLSEQKFENDRFLPYWAELWPACECLFSFLSTFAIPARSTVCELGCGLGAISACLAAAGHRVISCDISHEACRYASHNIVGFFCMGM